MSNKHIRLLIDTISQKYQTKNQIDACVLSEIVLGIKCKPVPTFKSILFKKVLVPHNGGCKTKKILKVKHRAK